MVTRVSGRANNVEISFEWQGGDRWEAIVPSNLEGEYIVDLYAEDDAGNRSYICKALFAISGHELHACIIPHGFSVTAEIAAYQGLPEISEFLGMVRKRYFVSDASGKTEYTVTAERGGYTIERAVCSRDID